MVIPPVAQRHDFVVRSCPSPTDRHHPAASPREEQLGTPGEPSGQGVVIGGSVASSGDVLEHRSGVVRLGRGRAGGGQAAAVWSWARRFAGRGVGWGRRACGLAGSTRSHRSKREPGSARRVGGRGRGRWLVGRAARPRGWRGGSRRRSRRSRSCRSADQRKLTTLTLPDWRIEGLPRRGRPATRAWGSGRGSRGRGIVVRLQTRPIACSLIDSRKSSRLGACQRVRTSSACCAGLLCV